jgi:predicted ATPase
MNLITALTARIEDYRAENKQPCKSYATEAAAERATAAIALHAAHVFTRPHLTQVESARYVVFFNAAWGRWVGCVDMTELMHRSSSTGGYVGVCTGFYTY